MLQFNWSLITTLQNHFASKGPFVTWDYLRKVSPAIPTQIAVREHVDIQLQSHKRGKRHSTPKAGRDIAKLAGHYHIAKLHSHSKGRKLNNQKDRYKNFVEMGLYGLDTKIKRWKARRLSTWNDEQHLEDLFENEELPVEES